MSSLKDGSRSKGVHLSDILRAIAFESGLLNKKYQDDGEDSDGTKVALGLAWEDWVSRRIDGISYHPGEFESDGIAMSPDGISFDPDDVPRVHEIKLTFKSSNRELADEFLWMHQVRSYCRVVGTQRATLHVYWVNGDYRSCPTFNGVYDIEFTSSELEETWRMVTQYLKARPDLFSSAG